jgi:SAM-dependent methyltransferase
VITGKPVEIIHQIKNFPVFFGCVDTDPEDDLFADMIWGIDKETGVIQLTKLIPLDILYHTQHVDGTGPTWQAYYEDFSEFVLEHKIGNVLEIGGGSGKLAEITTTKDKQLQWTIVEPNPLIRTRNQIKVVNSFFDEGFCLSEDFATVVFSQVMEHSYYPREFVRNIARILPKGGAVVFAYPQLTKWLDEKYTNALNFEHTILIDDFLEEIFEDQGLKVQIKLRYGDHSNFFVAIKSESAKGKGSYLNLARNYYNYYENLYRNFVEFHDQIVSELNEKILASTSPVYLFGAHIFATYLFAYGLSKDISGILDNSPLKQGKRLYGTTFVVASPRILAGLNEANVILKAGIYNQEIKEDILANVNPRVNFW